MFIVSLTYKVPIEIVDKHITDHITYLKEQYNAGHFIASGRKVPRTGGIILSNIESIDELHNILSKDPFYIHEIAAYDITEFVLSMTSKELEFLINK